MNNPGEFEGMEEATLKDLAFLSRSSREPDKVGRAWWMCEHFIIKWVVLMMARGHCGGA